MYSAFRTTLLHRSDIGSRQCQDLPASQAARFAGYIPEMRVLLRLAHMHYTQDLLFYLWARLTFGLLSVWSVVWSGKPIKRRREGESEALFWKGK